MAARHGFYMNIAEVWVVIIPYEERIKLVEQWPTLHFFKEMCFTIEITGIRGDRVSGCVTRDCEIEIPKEWLTQIYP